jgi:dihydropyrimidinase
MGVLIRNGTIVTALDRWVGDLLCREGTIVALGTGLDAASDDEIVDASGRYVFPGGIDPHVHMELPFMGTVSADDFETGSAAGVAGGTTTIIDFVVPGRDDNALEVLDAWHEKARKAVADYGFHMCITSWGRSAVGWMESCVREKGIPSFKLFMAYRGAIGIDDTEIIQALRAAAGLGALIMVHAEHGEMVVELQNQFVAEGKTAPKYHALSRPSPVEGEATARMIMMARMVGAPVYVVHMTCRESVRAVAEARERGQRVYGETCPQYLLLDDSVYEKPDFEGAAYVMSPPIRPRGHQDVLWGALGAGILEVVGSDHCPFNQAGQKEMGRDDFRVIPNGAAGVEDRLALLYTFGVRAGKIDLHQFVNLTSTRAAKVFGLYPRKGSITVGADADLVIWDPEGTKTISAKTHHHHCDRSIYEGFQVKGIPSTVIANGRVQYRNGDLNVERGAGRYLPRRLIGA